MLVVLIGTVLLVAVATLFLLTIVFRQPTGLNLLVGIATLLSAVAALVVTLGVYRRVTTPG